MSQKRPWNTALSSLVITLSEDTELAARTAAEIATHRAITAATAVDRYLPITIESADAREIHRWLESLSGVCYIDVIFCSTEVNGPSTTSPLPS